MRLNFSFLRPLAFGLACLVTPAIGFAATTPGAPSAPPPSRSSVVRTALEHPWTIQTTNPSVARTTFVWRVPARGAAPRVAPAAPPIHEEERVVADGHGGTRTLTITRGIKDDPQPVTPAQVRALIAASKGAVRLAKTSEVKGPGGARTIRMTTEIAHPMGPERFPNGRPTTVAVMKAAGFSETYWTQPDGRVTHLEGAKTNAFTISTKP